MPTCITHVYRWSYEVCQLVSPIILMPTCITHVYRWSYEVCQLTSPRDIFELSQTSMPTYITHYPFVIEILKYVDIHHLWVQLDHFLSMPTCITHVCSRPYEVCWLLSQHCWQTWPMGIIELHHACMKSVTVLIFITWIEILLCFCLHQLVHSTMRMWAIHTFS